MGCGVESQIAGLRIAVKVVTRAFIGADNGHLQSLKDLNIAQRRWLASNLNFGYIH